MSDKTRRKLCSIKMWMSIASFASMIAVYFGTADSEAQRIAALIMAGASVIGYVIGEGLADSSPSYEMSEIVSEGNNEEL